jgi:V/A-type H+-transporting ATPase subunit A
MTTGSIEAVTGSIVLIQINGPVSQNETCYIVFKDTRLLGEVIKIQGNKAYAQVYESTRGLYLGCPVEFTGSLLSVVLGPGLIGGTYDGLQNDLYAREGLFLQPGESKPALQIPLAYTCYPLVQVGDRVSAGDALCYVEEGTLKHYFFVPDGTGYCTVREVKSGIVTTDVPHIAVVETDKGSEVKVPMKHTWPIRKPIGGFEQRVRASKVLFTGVRALDLLHPIAVGGTGFIPGPFGCGKTVLQQSISRNADADLIVFAACGERANEIIELLEAYKELKDPKTGRSLMERTIMICNTSNMPVAAREASLYTAMTVAEYYRNMGVRVLLLADSTSRWAQALRELSNRLEELPGPESYPVDLSAIIASYYARAGEVQLKHGATGSITFIGTVSPAGGNFREPVTEATRKTARSFYALSQQRADTRRYPAIDPLESYSRYTEYPEIQETMEAEMGTNWPKQIAELMNLLVKGKEAAEQINILGDDAVPLETHLHYWESEMVDFCLLQQDAFDAIDGCTQSARLQRMVTLLLHLLQQKAEIRDLDQLMSFYKKRIFLFRQLNYLPDDSSEWNALEEELMALIP